jgi:hypothetical protein
MKVRPLHIVCIVLSLVLGSCAIPAESPVADFGTVQEYFWPTRDAQLQYHVYNGLNNAPVVHNVRLARSGDTIYAFDVRQK